MLEYWGRSEKGVENIPLFTALPEAAGQGFEELLTNVLATGERLVANELPVTLNRNSHLETTWINFIYDPIRDPDQLISGIIVVCSEVTEQVKAKKKIEELQDTLNLAMEAGGIGTCTVNLANDRFTCSERIRELYNLPDDDKLTLKQVIECTDDAYLENYQVNGQKGKIRWLRTSGKAFYNDANKPVYLAGTTMDITEQKQEEVKKNDFIDMVSHELKTPLTSIKAYTQILQSKLKNSQAETFAVDIIDKMNVQIRKMINMINGFLNVSRLEVSKIQFNFSRVNFTELIKESIIDARLSFPGYLFVFESCEDIFIQADHDKIASVISNLMSNAAKYSKSGTDIVIHCENLENGALFSISDEGIGVRQHAIPNLFERFYRAENDASGTISGFGIGLYLCDEIIKGHNGQIWVDSEYGKGSTFSFTLPQ